MSRIYDIINSVTESDGSFKMEDYCFVSDNEYAQINQMYDECLDYLKQYENDVKCIESEALVKTEYTTDGDDDNYETIEENKKGDTKCTYNTKNIPNTENDGTKIDYKIENELGESVNSIPGKLKSERLRRLSLQLPKIIITDVTNIDINDEISEVIQNKNTPRKSVLKNSAHRRKNTHSNQYKTRNTHENIPKRLVSKNGMENVALISNVPYEKMRLLNDTFHTLINLRWRWIITGTVAMHFALWLVFAALWYVVAMAHYDFEPEPPQKPCITGGKDFITIFLASVEAQTTIGFGDRAIDEECPEAIFLFIMQLILGTGLSGVLTCVVYAKLTRPEKLSKYGVGFSKKAVICMRDGRLCLMFRAWDLNHDHIISSEFTAHYIYAYKTREGELIRHYASELRLQQRQFLLWPVTLVHEIDHHSPLYKLTPQNIMEDNYEISVTLKGASASMGTFTQSQTSYLPREVMWGHRFPPVVKYDFRKQKYVIDHPKLNSVVPVDTPDCSAYMLDRSNFPEEKEDEPATPSSFSETMSTFHVERASSFKRK